jgi:hypothetical protein
MKRLFLLMGATLLVGLVGAGDEDPVSSDMARGAHHFLQSLVGENGQQARIAFDDPERSNWHYIPRERRGVSYKKLTPAQKKLADALLVSGLSTRGMQKSLDIMYLDQILFEIQKRDIRDPDLYYVSVFGDPLAARDWGWRVEGHHLSLNFTLRNGRLVSAAPLFMGANPAEVKDGAQKGLRVLADEEERGRALLQTFPAGQKVRLVIEAEAPRDIVTGASRVAEPGPPRGVSVADMTPEQASSLMRLIELYAHRLRPELADNEMKRIRESGVERLHFAWAGSEAAGQPHYYRIQGPTFLIEYDNTQDNANHIHTVWRDLVGDFGGKGDPLAEHYARSHHHQHAGRGHVAGEGR